MYLTLCDRQRQSNLCSSLWNDLHWDKEIYRGSLTKIKCNIHTYQEYLCVLLSIILYSPVYSCIICCSKYFSCRHLYSFRIKESSFLFHDFIIVYKIRGQYQAGQVFIALDYKQSLRQQDYYN